MTRPWSASPPPLGAARLRDWLELAALVLMWGSAFAVTAYALESFDPWWVTALRLALAALLLIALLAVRGERLPRDRRSWAWFACLGLIGNVLPFVLIAWGQQYLPSSLAGILMAAVPLLTLVLAHRLLPDEPLDARRFGAFVVGFTGVVLLIDPRAVHDLALAGPRFVAQLAILLAAACYALNAVAARLAPPMSGQVLATGVLCAATPQAVLLAAWLAPLPPWPSAAAAVAIIALGIFPTALGAALLYPLIGRAGAGFVSTTNYLVPICALATGVVLLDESPVVTDYLGLALILGGIAWSRRR